jgi:hypothetical protein
MFTLVIVGKTRLGKEKQDKENTRHEVVRDKSPCTLQGRCDACHVNSGTFDKKNKHELDTLFFLNIRTPVMLTFGERISKNELPDIFLKNRAMGAGMHKYASLT